jgi:hypothetical protein
MRHTGRAPPPETRLSLRRDVFLLRSGLRYTFCQVTPRVGAEHGR